ncbi:MAG: Na/Pi symporter [Calditrichaeota bacterium]|nr:Na/Pi symporter [Calditrichota bacterium]HQU73865.1 Na/Pi symporter [Calditrichia bacterium]
MSPQKTAANQAAKTILQVIQLLLFLYLFLVSINLMGASMKMFGKGFAETLINNTANPLVGLFIGIFATSLVQSSSTTTSIVVGLVGGGVMTVSNAIPIIMGANMGTSVTNTLVSLANMNRSEEFKRSFSASIVHDFFNLLSVLVLFPLQQLTNFLGAFAEWTEHYVEVWGLVGGGAHAPNFLKTITTPAVDFLKHLTGELPWLLLILSFVILFLALQQIVSALRALVIKRAEAMFDKILFKNGFRAFLVGLVLTLAAQSSSITTSLIVPMAGAGLLTLHQIFPYTLGANVGTTITAILASLVTSNPSAVTVAFAHLLFNVCGIVIWWPLSRVPLGLTNWVTEKATVNKIYPLAYIALVFFIIPLIVILLFR